MKTRNVQLYWYHRNWIMNSVLTFKNLWVLRDNFAWKDDHNSEKKSIIWQVWNREFSCWKLTVKHSSTHKQMSLCTPLCISACTLFSHSNTQTLIQYTYMYACKHMDAISLQVNELPCNTVDFPNLFLRCFLMLNNLKQHEVFK